MAARLPKTFCDVFTGTGAEERRNVQRLYAHHASARSLAAISIVSTSIIARGSGE